MNSSHFSPRRRVVTILAVGLSLMFLFGAGQAAATGFITPGSQRASEGGTAGVIAGTQFQVYLEANRSYACTVIPATSATTLELSNSVEGPTSNTTAVYRGNFTPVITAANALAAKVMRLALTPSETGLHTFTVLAATGTETVRPECLETTLYGGYNTNVNNFNFLELTNISNLDIDAEITAVNYDGTVVIEEQDVTIPAGRRVDVDIHTAAGPAVFGLLKVTHDGPFGSLQGSLSQYKGTVGDFSLSVSSPLRPRDQNL